jgi:CheY-like chemotaxis protein
VSHFHPALLDAADVPNPHLAGRVIVVVDDDDILRELFELILQASSVTVIATGDSIHAEQLIADTQPDLVLLDVDMPALDGLEVARGLKANPQTSSIPFMFVTGADMSQVRASSAGAAGLVSKPFDPFVLETAIDDILAGAAPLGLGATGRTPRRQHEPVPGRSRRVARGQHQTVVPHVTEHLDLRRGNNV